MVQRPLARSPLRAMQVEDALAISWPAIICNFTLHIANRTAPSHHSALSSQVRLPHGTEEIALLSALQGLGIAPLFVPVSQLAYSFLSKNQNKEQQSIEPHRLFETRAEASASPL